MQKVKEGVGGETKCPYYEAWELEGNRRNWEGIGRATRNEGVL